MERVARISETNKDVKDLYSAVKKIKFRYKFHDFYEHKFKRMDEFHDYEFGKDFFFETEVEDDDKNNTTA